MRKFNVTVFVTMFAVLTLSNLFAQSADTLLVPATIGGNPLGAINATIQGDTTTTGERNNPNRVYLLERGKVYFMDSFLNNDGWTLNLVGQTEPEDERPAVIMPGVRADGSIPTPLIKSYGNLTIKNIYVMLQAQNGGVCGTPIDVYPDDVRLIVDNCILEGSALHTIRLLGSMPKCYITNTTWRNNLNETSWYNGRGVFIQDALADTLVMVNNTLVNQSSYAYTDRDRGTNYMKFEHNTLVNFAGYPFFLHNITNGSISNNIFYNCTFTGEDGRLGKEYFGGWNDRDLAQASLISIDTLDGGALKITMDETDRVIQVENNAYYWEDAIVNAWESTVCGDSLLTPIWMNQRTIDMFADDEAWPNLSANNNVNLDPEFVVAPTVIDSIVKYISLVKDLTGANDYRFPEGKQKWMPDWPLPEDLSYSNATLLTAADGQYPVGDLNWFPAKKAEWEDDQTAIDEPTYVNTPHSFKLSQNYPNPFNPTTTIAFSLLNGGNVKLSIYNILGQKVRTLVDTKMIKGNYSSVWNGLDDSGNILPSGIYYYTLETESQSATKKMILMK